MFLSVSGNALLSIYTRISGRNISLLHPYNSKPKHVSRFVFIPHSVYCVYEKDAKCLCEMRKCSR